MKVLRTIAARVQGCHSDLRSMGVQMTAKPKPPTHKLGANRKEVALKARVHDPNFAQSRDIRESRGERQMKVAQTQKSAPPRAKAAATRKPVSTRKGRP